MKPIKHYYKTIPGWFDFEGFYLFILDKFQFRPAHFVELGGWLGKSAVFMATEIHNRKLKINFDVVDTWQGTQDGVDSPIYISEAAKLKDSILKTFIDNIKPVKRIIYPIQATTEDAARIYGIESLDFVFIDADHGFEAVKSDIENWLPKVKRGGILGGHDYFNNRTGVKQAVQEKFKIIKTNSRCWYYEKV